ncbi:MAG: hypothetical protein GOV02_03160 [Candidatus Aenigmarchaeota archaeon]|nr:hypothetical protein [Candidatus Aenigmarchaeota archaeon]
MPFKNGNIPWNKGKIGLQKAWNKGISRSEEIKKKISESCIGRISSFKGKRHTNESKKKMSLSKKGIYYGVNNPNYGNGEKMLGEKNPAWKGGSSFQGYCQVWGDSEYKHTIRIRDSFTCQNCGISELLSLKVFDEVLSIHHIDYDKQNCNPNNLITVCRSCNSKANNRREEWIEIYKNVMEKKYGCCL